MKRISFQVLSKYRTHFMGIAIICIILCHNSLKSDESFSVLIKSISSILQCGVDIFMILSGLGLYFSFNKNPIIWKFYRKRYSKILIPYVIVVLLYMIVDVWVLQARQPLEYLWDYSLISFFTHGKICTWFISAILVLYTVFPLLYKVAERSSFAIGCVCICVDILCVAFSMLPQTTVISAVNDGFVSRISSFLVGMLIGKHLVSNIKKRDIMIDVRIVASVCIVSMILIISIMFSELKNILTLVRLLFLPLSLSSMLLIGTVMESIVKVKWLDKFLVFIGGITLELYLIHEKILFVIDEVSYRYTISPIIRSAVTNILAIILSLFCAWLLQKITVVITNSRRNKL